MAVPWPRCKTARRGCGWPSKPPTWASGKWFDPPHGRRRWSDRCRELFGLRGDDGMDITEERILDAIHPDDRERWSAAVRDALDPRRGDGTYRIEYRIIGVSDGVERWISATGRTVFEGDRAVRMLGTMEDATERKRAEQDRDIFLRILRHDLRSPLSAISDVRRTLAEKEGPGDGAERDPDCHRREADGADDRRPARLRPRPGGLLRAAPRGAGAVRPLPPAARRARPCEPGTNDPPRVSLGGAGRVGRRPPPAGRPEPGGERADARPARHARDGGRARWRRSRRDRRDQRRDPSRRPSASSSSIHFVPARCADRDWAWGSTSRRPSSLRTGGPSPCPPMRARPGSR